MSDQCLHRKNWAKHYPKYNKSDYDQAYFPSYRFFTRRPSIHVTAASRGERPCVYPPLRARPTPTRTLRRAPSEDSYPDSYFPHRIINQPTDSHRQLEVEPHRQIEDAESTIPISAKKLTRAPQPPGATKRTGTTVIRNTKSALHLRINENEDTPLFIMTTNETNYYSHLGKKSDRPGLFYISVETLGPKKEINGYKSLNHVVQNGIDAAIWDLQQLIQKYHYPYVVYQWDEENETLLTYNNTAKEVTDYIYQSIDAAVTQFNRHKEENKSSKVM